MITALELATLTVSYGAQAKCASEIVAYASEPGARGRLLGLWSSEIGPLNRILVLREFSGPEDLAEERRRTHFSANPFGAAEHLQSMSLDTYLPFPGLPRLEPAALGPLYEFRTYIFRTGGLRGTLDAWQQALPARLSLSPLAVAMYATDGQPRFTHIWPYPNLDARAAIRAEAARRGIWPPSGAPSQLTPDLVTTIWTPLPGSPFH